MYTEDSYEEVEEKRRRADENLRQSLNGGQVPAEASGPADQSERAAPQAGSEDAARQSSSEHRAEDDHASESSIKIDTTNADEVNFNQANSINHNSNSNNTYNLILDGNAVRNGFEFGGAHFVLPGRASGERFRPSAKKPEKSGLPAREDIESWYRDLEPNEKCFIQVMAVFQGAPEHEILQIAHNLFEAFQREERRRKNQLAFTTHDGDEQNSAMRDTMLDNIDQWTILQDVGNAERLFWQDTDENGLSAFGVAVIRVIDKVSGRSVGISADQGFLPRLEEWSKRRDGEYSWRATRVLGTLWWKKDKEYFLAKAEQLARSKWIFDWERAANFLYGAYLYEYEHQNEEEISTPIKVPPVSSLRKPSYSGKKKARWTGAGGKQVLEVEKAFRQIMGQEQKRNLQTLALLEQWIVDAHTLWRGNIGVSYAVAQAYKWIGQTSLQPALSNLQALLNYPRGVGRTEVEVPELIFITVIWSYVTLATTGAVYEVVLYLAEQIKVLSFERVSARESEQWEQNTISLSALFLAFFTLIRLSLSAVTEGRPGTYSRALKLEEHPAFPDNQGRDLLLAAILSQEEPAWRACLAQVFCAAMIEGQAERAFALLEEWAKLVLRKHEAETLKLRLAYRQFLQDIGETIYEWCMELENVGGDVDVDDRLELYEDKLREWIVKYEDERPPSPLGAFAKDVLERLSF